MDTLMYVCAACFRPWPCLNVEHHKVWYLKQWFPEKSNVTIPCWGLDHEECRAPDYCQCNCHGIEWVTGSAISVPPSNR